MQTFILIAIAAIANLLSTAAFATSDQTAQVALLQASWISYDCFYFTLAGVSVADSAVPGGAAWFAMPRSQVGANQAFATLLAVKATGGTVRVITTGSAVCGGFAQVSIITMN